jgi:hypothetical protein
VALVCPVQGGTAQLPIPFASIMAVYVNERRCFRPQVRWHSRFYPLILRSIAEAMRLEGLRPQTGLHGS